MLIDFFLENFSIFAYEKGLFVYYYCLIFGYLTIFLIIIGWIFRYTKIIIFIGPIGFIGLFLYVTLVFTTYPIISSKRYYSIEKLYSEGIISKKTFDRFYPEIMKERLEAEKEAKEEEAKAKEEEEKQRIKEIEKQKIREERLKEIEEAEKEFNLNKRN